VKLFALNVLLTISGQHPTSPYGTRVADGNRHRIHSGDVFLFCPRGGASDMSVDELRPETNLLSAFTLMIVGAFAAGLPMAVAITWFCS
jgi:hypothetical protein